MIPIPFAWAEVALHSLINYKCAAQRVGTGKSKYEEKSRRTVWGVQGCLIWPWSNAAHASEQPIQS